MRDIHTQATALLARIVKVGQDRGEIRNDMDPLDIAQTLRQSLLGTLLIWSLYGDGSLESRIENVLTFCGMVWQMEMPLRKPCVQRKKGN